MTKDETLKLALEALEADPLEMVADANGHMVFLKDKAITAIKQALAQPAPYMAVSNDRMSVDPHTGSVSIGTVKENT